MRSKVCFVFLMGIVSLFGDIVYESARSTIGPYFKELGASATIIGITTGIAEFLGYSVRIISGFIADKMKAYWFMTSIGYGLLSCIPLLAFSESWKSASLLIILERIGKGIRTPSRDAILSYATEEIGRGKGFGLHEALDQIGAILGPFVFSFLLGYGYRKAFSMLWIPLFFCLFFLFLAKRILPDPHIPESKAKTNTSKVFLPYSLFIFFSVAGFSSFQIISYHMKICQISDKKIPILYSISMASDALAAIFAGSLYDKKGLRSLILIPPFTAVIPFFVFSKKDTLLLLGTIIWGIVLGIHETIIRASIADITYGNKRGLSYGIFNTVYGSAFFLGSSAIGYLYDLSISYVICFTLLSELLSLIFLFKIFHNEQNP